MRRHRERGLGRALGQQARCSLPLSARRAPPLWREADISPLRLQRPVCTHAQLRQVGFGVGACGQFPFGVASCVVLIVRAAARRWRGRCGVPVGRDVGRDGATPNAECTPEHCAIVLASASFGKSDALAPFYCFLFVVPDLPHHTDALRCNFFFNLPFQCCLGRLCGARDARVLLLLCCASRGLCAVARVILVC